MKKLKLAMFLFMIVVCAKAQIGYQVSLLNTATGEPRANESVTVSVSLSDSEGKVFYSETKSATTNDFGVLSLSIGNADMFKEVDLTKMPFFIEATANGVMIGKSQILSVPVAEVAKRFAPAIDINELVGTWEATVYYGGREGGFVSVGKRTLSFSANGTGVFSVESWAEDREERWMGTFTRNFEYTCEGNHIYIYVLGAGPVYENRSKYFIPYMLDVSLHDGKLLEVGAVSDRYYNICFSYTK